MNLLPTFGFKGTILPVIDKNDKLYLFIKNDGDCRVLLNIVSVEINKFFSIDSKSTKLLQSGVYRSDLHIKIFYMGQELFDFNTKDLDKNSFLLYSSYIIKTTIDVDRITISPSFMDGVKITTLSNKPQQLFITIVDKNTNEIIHEDNFMSVEPYIYNKDYFIDYDISIFNSNGKKIYQYDLDLKHKKVWIKLDSKAIGDTVAWIPYVEEFRQKHGCDVICTTYWNDLFISQYPYINFVQPNGIVESKTLFAIYKIRCSIPHKSIESPVDYREVGLQEMASRILGLTHVEIRPSVLTDTQMPMIDGEYVVIATMATSKAKLWNNPNGWQETVDYLVSKGLKVVLLQKEQSDRIKNVVNMSGIEDIHKTIHILKHCKFFIGLSSGLSWLAWALGKKVVMISGLTEPYVEFRENCYRVINTSVCHGCWNDKEHQFDRGDWFWCPRNNNFECTKEIKSEMVIDKINQILGKKDI